MDERDHWDQISPEAPKPKTFDDLTPVELTDDEKRAINASIESLPLKYRTVEMSRLLGTALRDPDFVPRLRAEPRKYFETYCGIRLPAIVNVVVHPFEENTIHLVLPNPNPRPAPPERKEAGRKILVTDADLVSDFAYARGRDLAVGDYVADDNDDQRDSVDDPGGWQDFGTDDGKDVRDADADRNPAD